MGYRCLNNLFGYCKDFEHRTPSPDNPTFVTAGGVHTLKDTTPTSCTLDPRNCGFFIFWDEVYRRAMGPATPTHGSSSFKEVS